MYGGNNQPVARVRQGTSEQAISGPRTAFLQVLEGGLMSLVGQLFLNTLTRAKSSELVSLACGSFVFFQQLVDTVWGVGRRVLPQKVSHEIAGERTRANKSRSSDDFGLSNTQACEPDREACSTLRPRWSSNSFSPNST